MDIDDLEQLDGSSEANARTSRFAPKSSKFAPKPKAKPESKPAPQDLAAIPKPGLDQSNASISKKEEDSKEVDIKPAVFFNGAAKKDDETKLEDDPMEEDDRDVEQDPEAEADRIVREIDVCFSPSIDDNTQLYLMQYPLRPSWHQYEFERCEEVRVNPASRKMEVDISLDVDSEHYNEDVAANLRITKMTLHTQWKTPLATGYAVGVLVGDKFHLNPIHAAVQLRPSKDYASTGSSKHKNVDAADVEVAVKKEGPPKGKQTNPPTEQKADDKNLWLPLEYHSTMSDSSASYLQKMMTDKNTKMQFTMKPNDYVDSFCPGASSNAKATGPKIRSFLSLPLEERFKKLLSEGPPIQRFITLKHFAPDASVEDVLKVLQEHACLVQGLWVPKSMFLLKDLKKSVPRDYVLVLFSKKTEITSKEVEAAGIRKEEVKVFLKDFAIERPSMKDWKFKEQPDVAFMKQYPEIVKKQEEGFKSREELVMKIVKKSDPSKTKPKVAVKSESTVNSDKGERKLTPEAEGSSKISDEIQEAMPKLLKKVFLAHKACCCSLQQIRRGLENLAVSQSTIPKQDPRLASTAAKLPDNELQRVVEQFAVLINGLYVLKLSPENTEPKEIRNIVLELLVSEGKFKKSEVKNAAILALKRPVSDTEVNKVVGEICVHKSGGTWVLKSSDGEPK